jgi:hypothetical protein
VGEEKEEQQHHIEMEEKDNEMKVFSPMRLRIDPQTTVGGGSANSGQIPMSALQYLGIYVSIYLCICLYLFIHIYVFVYKCILYACNNCHVVIVLNKHHH